MVNPRTSAIKPAVSITPEVCGTAQAGSRQIQEGKAVEVLRPLICFLNDLKKNGEIEMSQEEIDDNTL